MQNNLHAKRLQALKTYHIPVDNSPQSVDVHVLKKLLGVLNRWYLFIQVLYNILEIEMWDHELR